jgi:predicted regulator of Ras-like GTPase activity (Roadblock/LC7/MglB family)
MPSIEGTLRALRDVQGVYGSFVIAGTGALVARDLPAVFDGDLFAEVGPRITRLYETFLSGGEELDACVMRYSEHKIYLKKMTWGLIGIISGVGVNMPALRMVANLVVRRIDPEVASSLRPPPAIAQPAAVATEFFPSRAMSSSPPLRQPSERVEGPVEPTVLAQDGRDSSPPTDDGHVRMYRGRRVVDE